MPTVDGLRHRVQRLQQRRAGTGTASGPDPLTTAERIAAVSAMREYLGEYWQAEGYTEPGRDTILAYIEDGIARLEMAGA